MKCTALCMCAALLPVSFLQAGTQQIEAPQEGSVISFHLENDMFVGDDDNYTNGVRFAWMSGTTSRSHTFSGMLGTVLGARTPRIPGGGSWA
ncbi:MAG: lipid A-modifier LpxR family protein [Akkermansia sp.]